MHSLMSIFNSINNPLQLSPRQLQLIDRLSTEESRLATVMGTFVFSHRTNPYTQLYDGKDVRLLSPKLHQLDRLPACMGTLRDQQKTVEAMHLCLAYAKANGQNFADLSSWIAKYSGNGTAQLAFSDNGTFKESVYEATLRSLVAHLYAERTMAQNAPLTAVDRLAVSTEQTYASLTDEKGKYTLGSYLVMLRTLMSIILGRNTDPASLDFLFHVMDERNRLIHTRNVPPQPVEVVMEYYVLALFVMTMLTLQMANARATEGAVVSASEPDVELGVAATGKTFSLKTPNAIFGLQLPQGGNTLTATDSNGQRIARTVNAADSNFMLPQNWVKFDFGTTTAPSQQPVPTAGKSTATPPATAAPTMTDMERKTQMVNALKDGGNAFERKKYDEALEHFVQADKLLPSSLTKALIGSALYHLGNTKEAQKYLSQATLTRWGQHTAPHAHLLRAYMNLEDCKKRFQKTGKDEEWDPVRLDMAAFKQLDTKENPCVQLMPTKQLKRWFQQVPDCKEPRDLAATIDEEMNIAAKGLSDSQKRRKLEQLAKAKQEEATKGEVINLLIVVLTMAVTMGLPVAVDEAESLVDGGRLRRAGPHHELADAERCRQRGRAPNAKQGDRAQRTALHQGHHQLQPLPRRHTGAALGRRAARHQPAVQHLARTARHVRLLCCRQAGRTRHVARRHRSGSSRADERCTAFLRDGERPHQLQSTTRQAAQAHAALHAL